MSDDADLPTEKAQEPNEAAQHQLIVQAMSLPPDNMSQKGNYGVTFDENPPSEMSASHKSSYKNVLSQPAPGLSHRQRLLWLQKRRTTGLWVRCDDCDKWRYVAHVLDRHELPNKWDCRMNRDKSAADCSVPETPITVRDQEDFIHGEYAAGSIVWAHLPGWPWWPAMVDDCPDTEQYYWLDGFSDIPTHYNVVFFDTNDVTRAWMAPEHLKPYAPNKAFMQTQLLTPMNKYKKRIEAAMTQADDAGQLPLHNRLAKYSFLTRYKGKIVSPKKMNKEQLIKITNRLKRKYNINTYTDSSSDSDDKHTRCTPPYVHIFGTPTARIKKNMHKNNENKSKTLRKDSINCTDTDKTFVESSGNEFRELSLNDNIITATKDDSMNFIDTRKTLVETPSNVFKEPNTMSGQMGKTEDKISEVNTNTATGGSTPEKANDPETNTLLNRNVFTGSVDCPSSDDFEF